MPTDLIEEFGTLGRCGEGSSHMSTQDMYNYRWVSESLITAGQPTEEQLRAAAVEGITDIINLATVPGRTSLADEAGLVRSLGMAYHHIPVEWENPTQADFAAFAAVMDGLAGTKTLLHCAANFRASAFYALYGMKRLGWSEGRADAFMASIWTGSNYPIWQSFIAEMKARMLGGHPPASAG